MEHMFEDTFLKEKEYDKDKDKDTGFDMDNNNNTKISDTIFANIAMNDANEECQYLRLLETILEKGVWEEGRNGMVKSVFGESMRFSLKDGQIPILTTKKTAWKTCLKELLWFIKGDTDNILLKQQGVHIWDANGTRDFLNSRQLSHYRVDELGPIYGWQWRHFNRPYYCKNEMDYSRPTDIEDFGTKSIDQSKSIDQLQYIIDCLKDPNSRTSRRLIMSAWNPCQLNEMALPPCHILCQFNVHDGNQLSCAMYQRSADCFLGVPFNIASYSMLTHLIAHHCGLKACEFIHFMGNCHLYENAIDAATEQITRIPHPFPTFSIKHVHSNINNYIVTDFEVHNYTSDAAIKVDMVA